jgi:uncharacterized membrane protein required for colicin V production
MKIEWWMLDGAIILIVVLSALIGARRGLGASIIRLVGLVGGLVLAVLFGQDVTKYLMKTPFRDVVYERIFNVMCPDIDLLSKARPGSLEETAGKAAIRSAELASARITDALISIIAFIGIVVVVWFATFIIRMIFNTGRKNSIVIGGIDSLLGLALGIVKGVVLACLASAALIPVTTMIMPDKLPDMISAMQNSYLTRLVYEINPLLLALKEVIGIK